MSAVPHTEQALHQTANDLRGLGAAVKQDFAEFRHTANAQVKEYSKKVASQTNDGLAQLREYTSRNPLRSLAYAALGGAFLGLCLRR